MTSLTKINKQDLQNIISKKEYRDISRMKNDGEFFVIGRMEDLDRNISGVKNNNKNDLLKIEVALRKCRRVGFFKTA
jgi:hypothetical protein